MGKYNPYRWWTRGRLNKPLKASAPLLLKIRNGDFEYSYMFNEANEVKKSAQSAYDLTYKNYRGSDEFNRIYASQKASRMKRLTSIKLEIEAMGDENRILHRLKNELKSEFGVDLWDKAMEKKRGKGTLEDLYRWYKKQTKQATTKSEMDILLRRSNIKGLEYLL
jgi:hypothetical protein